MKDTATSLIFTHRLTVDVRPSENATAAADTVKTNR